jgi:hypothetical protein
VTKLHERLIAPGLEGQRDHGLKPASGFRDPGVLNAPRPIEYDKTPIVRPIAALELNRVIEQSIGDRLDNGPRRPEPGAARAVESIQTSNTSAALAGIVRVTVSSIVFTANVVIFAFLYL